MQKNGVQNPWTQNICSLVVDVSNRCNLKCATCPQGQGLHRQALEMMSMRRFRSLLEQVEGIIDHQQNVPFVVKFYNWSEPLMNPSIVEMVNLAKQHGFDTVVSSNLSLPLPTRFRVAQIDTLIVTVSGFSQATYELNHIGGCIDTVLSNLITVLESQEDAGWPKRVKVKYLVTDYNDKEVHDLRQHLESLPGTKALEEYPRPLRFMGRYPELRLEPFSFPRGSYVPGLCHSYRDKDGECSKLGTKYEIVVRADGTVFPCCSVQYDERLALGNAFDQGLPAIWQSKRFQLLKHRKLVRADHTCFNAVGMPE